MCSMLCEQLAGRLSQALVAKFPGGSARCISHSPCRGHSVVCSCKKSLLFERRTRRLLFPVLIQSKMNTQNTVSFRDTPARYDAVSRVLHWLSLLLLVAQFSLGWLMPDADSVKTPAGLVAWHVGIGTSLLAVFAARLVWVAMRSSPGPVDQHGVFRFLAAAVHVSMYALLLLVPLLGWLNASGRGWAVKLAGVWDMPQLATPDSLGASIGEWHSASATVLLILIGLHVFAVLVHQIGFKDRLLRRML